MKLHLGFEDFAYASRYTASSPLIATTRKRKPKTMTRSQAVYGEGKSTTDVAADLEQRYKIVETFYEMEEDNIIGSLQDVYGDAIEKVMSGEPAPETRLSTKETQRIEEKFRRSLTSRRYDGVIPGVPTTAAQRGVSHLYQHPYAKRAPRPSFIDTGMYQRSFRVWVEED